MVIDKIAYRYMFPQDYLRGIFSGVFQDDFAATGMLCIWNKYIVS